MRPRSGPRAARGFALCEKRAQEERSRLGTSDGTTIGEEFSVERGDDAGRGVDCDTAALAGETERNVI